MARDETRPVLIRYERTGERVRFALDNVDEHELRAFLIALWLLLEQTSRRDMISELAHYHEDPSAWPPVVSQSIADAYRKAAR